MNMDFPNDFLSHLGGDDFVIVFDIIKTHKLLVKKIIDEFFLSHYSNSYFFQ